MAEGSQAGWPRYNEKVDDKGAGEAAPKEEGEDGEEEF
jgi:hypothetical protein